MMTSSFFQYVGPGRVAISRSIPRRTPPGYRWFKQLAPPKALHGLTEDEYRPLYQELLAKLDPAETWNRLIELAGGAGGPEPVLLCWESGPFDGTADPFCHRRMVADWFLEHLGLLVPEIAAFDPDRLHSLPRAVCRGIVDAPEPAFDFKPGRRR